MLILEYAILRHTLPGSPHVDLMIENPDAVGRPGSSENDALVLRTWRVSIEPSRWGRRPMPLIPLPDHRRAYLQKSGPVSGGRGAVQRLGGGRVAVRLWTVSRIELEPLDERCWIRWELRQRPGGGWDLRVNP